MDTDSLRKLAEQVTDSDESIRPSAKPQSRRKTAARVYRCANCDADFVHELPKVYCHPRCADQADLVRYERRWRAKLGVADQPRAAALRAFPPDIREVIDTMSMFAIADGYDATARHLSVKEREFIWQRDHGRCVLCGAPGAEIDHIKGPSRDPSNLRLVCGPCNRRLARSHAVPVATLPVALRELAGQRLGELTLRIEAPEPLRACDDPTGWRSAWRQWVTEHASDPPPGT